MSYRTITIASTSKSGVKTLQSEAMTYGTLKDALRDEFGDLDKMRAVVRETRNDLASDDARLPDGAFTLLLTPRQIKAGASQVDVVKVLEDVKDRFSEGIDEIIDAVSAGDYNLASNKVSSTAASVTKSSASLAKELEDLKNGRF